MQELSFTQHDLHGHKYVNPTAVVSMKNKKELHLCDNVTELFDAVAGDKKFVAHEVIGNAPVQVLISPDAVATVQIYKR
jgi:hypothetical protein